MKKFFISVILMFAFLSLSSGQENPFVCLEEVIPPEFAFREFFVKNPMWAGSTFTVENLQYYKGKILHTQTVRYTLNENGEKFYGDCDGFPTQNRYIIFDSEGSIKYSCTVETQSNWEPEKKSLSFTEYKFQDGLYQEIEHTANSSTGLYIQKFQVKKTQNGRVNFYTVNADGQISEEPAYIFYAEGSSLVFENHFFEGDSKKLVFTNEYMKNRLNRTINTPRLEIKNNPLGFVEHHYSHPSQPGTPGDYCESTSQLQDSPDQLLLSSFPELFN